MTGLIFEKGEFDVQGTVLIGQSQAGRSRPEVCKLTVVLLPAQYDL